MRDGGLVRERRVSVEREIEKMRSDIVPQL